MMEEDESSRWIPLTPTLALKNDLAPCMTQPDDSFKGRVRRATNRPRVESRLTDSLPALLRDVGGNEIDLFANVWAKDNGGSDPYVDKPPTKGTLTASHNVPRADAVTQLKTQASMNQDSHQVDQSAIQRATGPLSPSRNECSTSLVVRVTAVDEPLNLDLSIEFPKTPKQIRTLRLTKPKVLNGSVYDLLHLCGCQDYDRIIAKSCLAGAAVTWTTIHLYDESKSDGYEEARVASLSDSNESKVSATLQVVRSSDSVYEVI